MPFRDKLSNLMHPHQQQPVPPSIPQHNKPSTSTYPGAQYQPAPQQHQIPQPYFQPQLQSPHQEQPQPSQPHPGAFWSPQFNPDTPVSTHFTHKIGQHGWGNNELQNYTPHAYNSHFTASGQLLLRAIAFSGGASQEDKYTSARLVSKQTLSRDRGFLFARLTAPCAKGVWPAFWLLPEEPFTWPNDGEVDIFEAWDGGVVNHSCLHWGQFNGEDWNKHRVIETEVPHMISSQGVVVGFAWDQHEDGTGKLVWYIDGKAVMKAECPGGTRRMREFTVVINVAMGGNVCGGKTPDDGSYDLVVHDLKMFEEPFGGWSQFGREWEAAPEGRAG